MSMTDTGERTPSVRLALAGLSLATLLASLGTSVANIALPTMALAFGARFQDVQWVVIAYLLASTTLIVSVGRLGDATGRRRLLLAGLGLFTVASVLCGLAPTLGLLVAARALQGLGAATLMALSLAFVAEAVPPERTGGAMGVLATMSAIGTALGPSLGGALIAALGWRAIFLVNLPLGIAALLLASRYLPAERARPAGERTGFDYAGTLLLAATLATYAVAMTIGRGRFGAVNLVLLAAFAAGATLFIRTERRAAAPLVRLTTFRDRTLSASLATSLLVSTVVMTALVVGPFYLSRALGLATAVVGLVITAGPFVVALAGVPAGRLADRFGPKRITVAGLGALVAGCAALALVPPAGGVAGFLIPFVVVTGGYAFFQTANNTDVMSGVSAERRGLVSGMLNLSRNLGLITGAAVMGGVFAFASGTTDVATAPPAAVAAALRITFAVAVVLAASALVIASGGAGRRVRAPRPARSA